MTGRETELAAVRVAVAELGELVEGRLAVLSQRRQRMAAAVKWLREEQRQRSPADPDAGIRLPPGSLFVLDDVTLAGQRERFRAGEPGPGSVVAELVGRAEDSLGRPTYQVTAKTTLPPSGDPHDYWHPAPYWWPNPDTPDGLPYLRRDGHRVPGTRLREPGSEQFDRSALQSMIDESLVTALAGYFTGQGRFYTRGASLLRAWFLDPRTRMNPHLRYAQVRRGHAQDQGSPSGIIETKDFHYLLDAARLLERAEALRPAEADSLRAWFEEYRSWLHDSEQGRGARAATNNRGTWYDAQLAAIDAYLYNRVGVAGTLQRVQARVAQQFTPDGRQPQELARTLALHYCAYNLQGWLVLAGLARRAGQDLWSYETMDGRGLATAARWLLGHLDRPWSHPQREPFQPERLVVLAHLAASVAASVAASPEHPGLIADQDPWQVRQMFTATEGIRPYWLLGLASTGSPSP